MISNTSLITALAHYVDGRNPFEGLGRKHIQKNYVWPIGKKEFPYLRGLSEKFDPSMSKYHKNILLKEESERIWQAGNRRSLAEWAIRTWGGIKNLKEWRIDEYLALYEAGAPFWSLCRVSSYSKLLSFAEPYKYPILDSRVATSLNAIQSIFVGEELLTFPIPEGQNKTIKTYNYQKALERANGKIKSRSEAPYWQAYKIYRELLLELKCNFDGCPVWELEMPLFADTEKLINLDIGSNL